MLLKFEEHILGLELDGLRKRKKIQHIFLNWKKVGKRGMR